MSNQSWGQQQHGYQPPQQPPKARRASSNTGLVVGLSAVAALLVVAIVVSAVFVSDGGLGDDDAYSARSVGWSVPRPSSESRTAASYPSKNGKVLIRVSEVDIVGYQITTGKRKWTAKLPEGMRTCASTNAAPDDVATVVLGTDGKCSDIMAIDVTTGKKAWQATLPYKDDAPSSATLSTAGHKVFVSIPDGLVRYDANPKSNEAKPKREAPPRGCEFSGPMRAGARAVAALTKCSVPAKPPSRTVLVSAYLTGFATKSLKPVFRAKLGDGENITDDLQVVSATPVIVRDTHADKRGELRLFDARGRPTKVLSAKQKKGELDFGEQKPWGVSADGNKEYAFQLVATTLVAPVKTTGRETAKVAGINLKNGKWVWTRAVGRRHVHSSVQLTTVDDDPRKVAAIDSGGKEHGSSKTVKPQLVTVDATKHGKLSRGDLLPESASHPGTTLSFSLGGALVVLRSAKKDTDLLTAYAH